MEVTSVYTNHLQEHLAAKPYLELAVLLQGCGQA
jgi:hypothetical protein